MPDPFGGQRAQAGPGAFRQRVTIVLDDLKVIVPGDGRDFLPPLQRHADCGGVLRLGRQAQDLRAVAAAGRLQRLGHDAVGVGFHRYGFRARQPGGMAKSGIGQFFGQNHGAVPPQAAQQDQADRVLPTMRQRDVIGRYRAKHAVANPVADRGAQGGLGPLAGVVNPIRPALRDGMQRIGKGRRLPHLGQQRRAQVHPAPQGGGITLQIQGLRRAKLWIAGGDKGAAPDRRCKQPLLRGQLIGAADRAGRDIQPPGQIAHRRQLPAFDQIATADRIAQRAAEGQVFRTSVL